MSTMSARPLLWVVVLLHVLVCVICTRPDVYRSCSNARKPANGAVHCGCYDVEELQWHGGKSSRSGGKSSRSSGSKSKESPYVCSCRYTCNNGYNLDGPSVLECPFDVIDNPTCVPVTCEVLPWIDHGILNCTNYFLYGSKCQYTCSSGFNISGGSDTLTCRSDGLWTNAVPKCQAVECPALEEPFHGSLSCPNGRSFGEDCRFTCDGRYRIAGETVLSCLESGQWNFAPPSCKIGECVPLPFLIHGSLTCTKSWDIGSRCDNSCDRRYKLKGGSRVLICGPRGNWRGNIPTCQRVFYSGKSNDLALDNDIPYEYNDVEESSLNEPIYLKAAAGPPTNDESSEHGLSTGAIIALLTVAVIVVSVAVGIFVAYRHKKHSRLSYKGLNPSAHENPTYQSTE